MKKSYFSFSVDFLYATTRLGVDPGYSSQSFYSAILHADADRVKTRFAAAEKHGIRDD